MTRPDLPALPMSALQLAILLICTTALSAVAAFGLARLFGFPHDEILRVAQLVTFAVGTTALLATPSLRKRAALLLRVSVPRSRYADVALAIVLAALAEFAVFGLYAASKWLDGGDEVVVQMSLSPARSADGAFAAATLRDLVITCLMAPLLEEIFYRGLLLEAWARTRSVAAAMLLSSIVFTLVHPTWLHSFFGGLLLAAVYVRTGALRACILVHFCANALNWYPLLGQFFIPADNRGIGSWSFQLACLVLAPAAVVFYAWLAVRSHRPAELKAAATLHTA